MSRVTVNIRREGKRGRRVPYDTTRAVADISTLNQTEIVALIALLDSPSTPEALLPLLSRLRRSTRGRKGVGRSSVEAFKRVSSGAQ